MSGPNGNGHKAAGLVPARNGSVVLEPQNATTVKKLTPASWWYQYAFFMAQALLENKQIPTQEKMAAALGLHRSTLCKALQRPGVHGWMREEIRRHTGADPEIADLVKLKVAGKALAGDLDAAELYLKAAGELDTKVFPVGGAMPGTAIQVNIVVPRANEPDAG